MNYIKHLPDFFNNCNYEPNLNPTHISLFGTFQCWNVNRFKNPTGISREEIMRSQQDQFKATYHKCMKELELLGFMVYNTFNPLLLNIIMINFLKKKNFKIPHQPIQNEPVHNLTRIKKK
jgi:hypothetical protein